MKKLIFSLFFVLFSFSTFAQELNWFKTTCFNYKEKNAEWGEWVYSDLNLSINFEECQIVIYSAEKQIIDFENAVVKKFKGGLCMYADATDSNYKIVKIELYVYTIKSFYLKVIYPKFEYKYQFIKE